MIFGVNTQVTYVELEENDVNRRYVLPNFENVSNKVLSAISNQPKVNLVRIGFATILSAPDTVAAETSSALQAIPSTVSAIYTIQMNNHDVLGTAQANARYSEELTQLIGNTQALEFGNVNAPVQSAIPAPAPAAPAVDLTAQLRAQMLSSKQAEFAKPITAPPVEPVTPSVPVSEPLPGQTEMKFEDFVAKKQAEKAVSKSTVNERLKPQPSGKIDILLREVGELKDELEELRAILTEMRSGLGV